MKNLNPITFVSKLIKIAKGKPNTPKSLENNELLKAIFNRRSVRKFTDEEIPEDIFNAILEAGRLAPSTVNLQPWSFSILSSQEWHELFDKPLPFHAQKAIIILGDLHRVLKVIPVAQNTPLIRYTLAVMNASLAAMNMNIAAEALGIASVMLSDTGYGGFFHSKLLSEKLKLPENVFPLMTIVFGYPSGKYPPMPPKLPIEQISFKDKYKDTSDEILEDWILQMHAGFKVTNPFSTFQAKLDYYTSNLERSEKELEKMIFQKSDGTN
jgi:FMN reductase (NADPH)